MMVLALACQMAPRAYAQARLLPLLRGQPLLSIEDLGCVANDPKIDNGPRLTAALARFGRDLTGCPFVPRKAFYFKTPAVVPSGIVIVGAGSCGQAMGDGHWGKNVPPPARFIRSEGNEPILKIVGQRVAISDIALQGESLPETPDANWLPTLQGPLIEIEWPDTPGLPTGGITFTRITCLAAEIGWQTRGDDKNHADAISLYDCIAHHVRIPYQIDGAQSVMHRLYGFTAKGSGDAVIDVRQGGFVTLYHPYFGERWDSLLRLGKSNHNNAYFRVHDLHVDSSARDVRLVRETAPTRKFPQVVTIDGHIGGGATIASEPVIQVSPRSQIEINLRSATPQNRILRQSPAPQKP